jgi:hypothetical protein
MPTNPVQLYHPYQATKINPLGPNGKLLDFRSEP